MKTIKERVNMMIKLIDIYKEKVNEFKNKHDINDGKYIDDIHTIAKDKYISELIDKHQYKHYFSFKNNKFVPNGTTAAEGNLIIKELEKLWLVSEMHDEVNKLEKKLQTTLDNVRILNLDFFPKNESELLNTKNDIYIIQNEIKDINPKVSTFIKSFVQQMRELYTDKGIEFFPEAYFNNYEYRISMLIDFLKLMNVDLDDELTQKRINDIIINYSL